MVSCRELIEFLDDYVAGTLPDGVRSEFELHLKLCSACRRYLESYRMTIGLERKALSEISEVDCEKMPDDMVAAIVAAMTHAQQSKEDSP